MILMRFGFFTFIFHVYISAIEIVLFQVNSFLFLLWSSGLLKDAIMCHYA